MPQSFRIERISTGQEAVRALITFHRNGMHANSPAEHVFALDFSGYDKPSLTLWGAFCGETLSGMVALQRLDAEHGEIKSMRTHPDFLRRGVAGLLLAHLIEEARGGGLARLSLETGRGPAFEPALALYRARGFRDGAAFGNYIANEFSQFLHLELGRAGLHPSVRPE